MHHACTVVTSCLIVFCSACTKRLLCLLPCWERPLLASLVEIACSHSSLARCCWPFLAALQGYGAGQGRNVRPRTSGGGGAPAAAAANRYGVAPSTGMPVGPPRQQQGFVPGAQQGAAVGFNPAAAQQRSGAGYGAPGYGAGEAAQCSPAHDSSSCSACWLDRGTCRLSAGACTAGRSSANCVHTPIGGAHASSWYSGIPRCWRSGVYRC